MIDFSTPLAGLDRASSAVEKLASRVAVAGNSGGDLVDLSEVAVGLIVARQSYASNIKVIQTEDAVTKNILSLLG